MELGQWIVVGVIVLSLIWVGLDYFFRRFEVGRIAKKLVDLGEDLYGKELQYVRVDATKFGWLDLDFYDRAQQAIKALRFQHLADIESISLSRKFPYARTFVRCMLNPPGDITAAIYHVRLRGLMAPLQWFGLAPRNMRIIEFETEFSDGTFLDTNNSEGIEDMPPLEQRVKLAFPRDTPAELLLEVHQETVTELLRQKPGLQPVRLWKLEDVIEAQERQRRIMADAHRKKNRMIQSIEDDDDYPAKQEVLAAMRREIASRKAEADPESPEPTRPGCS